MPRELIFWPRCGFVVTVSQAEGVEHYAMWTRGLFFYVLLTWPTGSRFVWGTSHSSAKHSAVKDWGLKSELRRKDQCWVQATGKCHFYFDACYCFMVLNGSWIIRELTVMQKAWSWFMYMSVSAFQLGPRWSWRCMRVLRRTWVTRFRSPASTASPTPKTSPALSWSSGLWWVVLLDPQRKLTPSDYSCTGWGHSHHPLLRVNNLNHQPQLIF